MSDGALFYFERELSEIDALSRDFM